MFEKLIEAARTCYESGNPIDECCIEGCPNFDSQPYCLDQILKDCVEALTQSGAELKDKDYLIQQQADEIERLWRDVKKQQEKMIELAKDRHSWMSAKDPPKKSCKVIVYCICNSTGETDVTTAYYRERYHRFHMTGNRSHWRVTHWIWPWSEPEEVQE